MNKSDAIIKDRIIKHLATVKSSEHDDILAKELNIPLHLITLFAADLEDDGLVRLIDLSSNDRSPAFNLTIEPAGTYFFENNSYISQYRTIRLTKLRKTVKANVIFAIAILTVYFAWVNIEHKQTNKELHERVNELELQLQTVTDSLNIIKKDSIN